MALLNFNAAEHNVTQSFDALPKGWYQARLTESEIKATSTGGQMVVFIAEILAPEWAKGRKTFLRYNTVNNNTEAVRIGMEQLAALSIAIGVPVWGNTEQLHGRNFHLKLKVTKGGKNAQTGEDYEDSNDAAGYDAITIHRQLAVQASAPVTAGAAPFAPPSAPVAAPAFPGGATPPAAAAFPVQPTPVQPAPVPVQPAPVQQPAPVAPAQPAPAQAAPVVAQPWNNPAAAPAQPWETTQQAPASAPVEPVAQPAPAPAPAPAPVQSPTPVQAAPTEAAPAPVAAPWQQQIVDPQPVAQQAAAAQPAQAAEVHPAQSAVPPWQQPATPDVQH